MFERIRQWFSGTRDLPHELVPSVPKDYVSNYSVKPDDLEIHLPISPTPHFFTMVRCFATSLRLFGGQLAGSHIVVTVGADQEPIDLARALPWSRDCSVEWRWLDRDLFRHHSYYATAVERFRQPFRAPVVLLADADVLVAGPLDDLVGETLADGRFGGLIAHVCPFPAGGGLSGNDWWQRLYRAAGQGDAPLHCRHTGFGFMDRDPGREFCPPYFNLGVLIAPAPAMARVGAVIYEEMEKVDRVLETFYRCQIAVALALTGQQLPWKELPLRYNFPNDHHFAERFPEELQSARLLHYLRTDAIDKARDFEDFTVLARRLKKAHPTAANALLFRRLQAVCTEARVVRAA